VSVLVFPFGFIASEMGAAAAPAAGADPSAPAAGLSLAQQHVASYLTASVKAGFLSSPYYSVASYHPNSSLVQRAQKDEILRPEHITGLIAPATGAADLEKARTITYRLGMQGLLVGSIDVKTDAKANTSEVTLETQLINSTTGEVIRSAAVSGAAAGAEGVPIDIVEERAALDAAQKVLPAMGIQLVALPSEGAAKAAPRVRGGKRTSEDKKADADAKRAADDARKAEASAKRAQDAAARKAKEDSEKAERAAREQAAAAEKARRDAEKKSRNVKPSATEAPEAKVQKDDPAQATAQEGTGKAVVQPSTAPVSITSGVPGTANAAGQPVPYGYALGDSKSALPQRDRRGLRIPAWLGVAGFLYGLSFLVF
jgi:hypothetical protein